MEEQVVNSFPSSIDNNKGSDRDQISLLKDADRIPWDREVVPLDAPYSSKRYHIPFNPPPNEVNFMKGLGKPVGFPRSKLHPNRPTSVQQIHNMRTRNNILVTLTEPVQDSHCLVKKQHKLTTQKELTHEMKHIVNKITALGIFDQEKLPDQESETSSMFIARMKPRKPKKLSKPPTPVKELVDDSAFTFNRDTILARVQDTIKRTDEEGIYASAKKFLADCRSDLTIRKLIEEKRQEKTKSVVSTPRRPTSSSTESSVGVEKPSTNVTDDTKSLNQKKKRKRKKRYLKHITGYMFGQFTKKPLPDPLMQSSTKFDIPLTMIDRGLKLQKSQDLKDSILRKERLVHLNVKLPPSNDDTDSEQGKPAMEEVKKVALIKTPYFSIPRIKKQQVKKLERFRNRYLNKERLRRINMLFYDRENVGEKKSTEKLSRDESREVNIGADIHEEIKKDVEKFKKRIAKKIADNPKKSGFYKIIENNYVAQSTKEMDQLLDEVEVREDEFTPEGIQRRFEEFKAELFDLVDTGINKESNNEETVQTQSDSKNNNVEENTDEIMKVLFKRSKNERLKRDDDIRGPLYVDPFFLENFSDNESKISKNMKKKKEHKYYASLLKGRFGVRNRLQVNNPDFDEEKIGLPNQKYFSRLATEWDSYYIHELRYRPPTRKFNVKTDILKLRGIVRNRFNMYYNHHNMLDVLEKHRRQKVLIDNVMKFQEMCDGLFAVWKNNAYRSNLEKYQTLKRIEEEKANKSKELTNLRAKISNMNEAILQLEQKLDDILITQNYYYLMMNKSWRLENDWIHRNENGVLMSQLVAYKHCCTMNIREKSEISGFAVKRHYEKVIEPNLEKMMSCVPELHYFVTGLQRATQRAFICHCQYNSTVWLYERIRPIYETLNMKLLESYEHQRNVVPYSRIKTAFMKQRVEELEKSADELLNKLLSESVRNPLRRKILGITNAIYDFIKASDYDWKIIQNTRNVSVSLLTFTCNHNDYSLDPIEKFTAVHEFIMHLLNELNRVPFEILRTVELDVRTTRQKLLNKSNETALKMKRFAILKRQMRHITQHKVTPISITTHNARLNANSRASDRTRSNIKTK